LPFISLSFVSATPLSFDASFNELDQLLNEWQWLWHEVPFKQPQLPWFIRFPHWQNVMDGIDDNLLERLATDMDALYTFARDKLGVHIDPRFYRLTNTRLTSTRPSAVPDTETHTVRTVSENPPGIRPRKWSQISAFGDALQAAVGTEPHNIVEWCAGKGHLSRQLLTLGLSHQATGLEINPHLVSDGQQLANDEQLALHLIQQDVLDNSVSRFCAGDSHHVALHACGRLHVSMLQHCSAAPVRAIDLVPCCYHLIDSTTYSPLSLRARQSALRFDDDALKLALQETVTAPGNARRNRERLQQWRLGFDCLQRDLRSTADYLPLPSFSVTQAGADFRAFCARCAELRCIVLPAYIDYAKYEAAGRKRFAQVSRYDLIRQLFRRPLELWLVFDRCLLLEERGYDVTLQEFCARELTPRNLWIHARRPTKT